MEEITVREIVLGYLIDHEYDGLYSDMGQCACDLESLMDCEAEGTCQYSPGYKAEDPSGEFEYLIVAKRGDDGIGGAR